MIFFEKGSPSTSLSDVDLKEGLFEALDKIGQKTKYWPYRPIIRACPQKQVCLLHLPINIIMIC